MAPKVTVLMSVYNGENFLQEAIESILNQTYTDFELLIINDCSADSSRDIILSYSDPRIRLIDNEQNMGLTKSLNSGLKLARGEYIARMDADDISFRDRIEKQIDIIEKNPRLAIVGGAVVQINDFGKQVGTMHYPLHDKQIKKILLNSNNCIAHSAAFIRKNAICTVGGYRDCFDYAQDYDLWLRLADRYELANLSKPVLYLRTHKNQVSMQRLRRQVIAALGARTAAIIRHETGRDPLNRVERVTLDTLYQLGVKDKIIQKEMIGSYLWWAENMLKMGMKSEMFQLFTEVREIMNSYERYDLMPRTVISYCYCAGILYSQRKYREGTGLLLENMHLISGMIKRVTKRIIILISPGW